MPTLAILLAFLVAAGPAGAAPWTASIRRPAAPTTTSSSSSSTSTTSTTTSTAAGATTSTSSSSTSSSTSTSTSSSTSTTVGAVSCSVLVDSFDDTNATSYTTASVSPTANHLVLLAVHNNASGTAGTPTASGNSLTYVQIATVTYSGNSNRVTLFRALGGSPSSGAITIDYGGSTQQAAIWAVIDCANVDTSGTDGSGAIVQSLTNTGAAVTSLTITLSAFGSTNNATFGAFGHAVGNDVTAGSGFSELTDTSATAPVDTLFTEFRNNNDTTVDASISASTQWGGVAIEIKRQ